MELGGNGGFTGYRRFPQPNSGMTRAAEISMGLPSKTSHNTPPSSSSSSPAAAADHTMMDGECTVREQDRFMPIANVIRIMRKILPPHAKISDDAKETIQECVSEYISFITGEANERCQREQRKTITAEDVLWAMSKLGFDDYIEPLTLYLHRFREFDGGERGSLRAAHDLAVGKRANIDHLAAAAGFGLGGGGFATYPPPHFHLPHHPPLVAAGFFTTAAVPFHMNGFLKDPSSTGGGQATSSQATAAVVANDGGHQEQAFDNCKE
ncbi:nuclear transcription factor Y subunit B-6-like [Coffea eugenioides]|uniref:Nuclear transcription factor Y subunit B-6-like n=1 Tax=Coffea arabica TaxID=13443 RepID=A0A6P6UD30_COFAR|nr:nuclear transcription factor Y subunit B-6-like [Coffea arabica]XP_027183626.1 nuclear transcription factor Y subunit B-6-like [Coffea eugenioides]